MKFLALLLLSSLLVIFVDAEGDSCYSDIISLHERKSDWDKKDYTKKCNAKYGAFKIEDTVDELQKYTMENIFYSFDYLMLAANFENYEKSRGGFQDYFRELSDDKWENGIELIKYITKRGGKVNFKDPNLTSEEQDYESCELGSLAHALNIEKNLAKSAFDIHLKARKHHNSEDDKDPKRHTASYDPEIASYMEEKHLHRQSSLVRELAGHVADMSELHKREVTLDVALFLFDEYLK